MREGGEAVEQMAVDPVIDPLDRGEVLGLEGDPVEQGDQAGRDAGVERGAELARPRHEAPGRPGFT